MRRSGRKKALKKQGKWGRYLYAGAVAGMILLAGCGLDVGRETADIQIEPIE